eukprot:CAMPEP_0206527732 /NCGR_PEP_ID=MMETSP0325_2-20121206/1523_1 /ASSEMBLY_ACC=CAM_ASM_000347 /TAXON_ID=2866 /ORGANISM="Crypthecodinium cohnii, Strain Seligo" /LENGTH=164 /DNA_ID=CAMNT_0054023197 /DNA_START=816 /DNA_END=1310 /DNA_ORIENTATION=+
MERNTKAHQNALIEKTTQPTRRRSSSANRITWSTRTARTARSMRAARSRKLELKPERLAVTLRLPQNTKTSSSTWVATSMASKTFQPHPTPDPEKGRALHVESKRELETEEKTEPSVGGAEEGAVLDCHVVSHRPSLHPNQDSAKAYHQHGECLKLSTAHQSVG